jgi:glycosyltransferase involved in cell wall biosynthesis
VDGSDRAADGSPGQAALVVVVPAHNEVVRVRECLRSLARQETSVKVFFSDNASDDGTAEAAREFVGDLALTVRTTSPMNASEHFVSAGRWALEAEPRAPAFALLAGDDTWSSGFAQAALATLGSNPAVGAVFPAFIWEEADDERCLPPVAFRQSGPAARRRRALLLPDHRELANLVYGVFRRDAFAGLLAAWERGGDTFAADYAAAWCIVGDYQVEACPAAVGHRHVRVGSDLIQRVGLRRADARGALASVRLYVTLNIRVNRLIATAVARAVPRAGPPSWQVQVIRAPQWLWGAVRQVRAVGKRAGSNR